MEKHLRPGAKSLVVGEERAKKLVGIAAKASGNKKSKEEEKALKEFGKLKKKKGYGKCLGKELLESLMRQKVRLKDVGAAVGAVRFLSGLEGEKETSLLLQKSPAIRAVSLKAANEALKKRSM